MRGRGEVESEVRSNMERTRKWVQGVVPCCEGVGGDLREGEEFVAFDCA